MSNILINSWLWKHFRCVCKFMFCETVILDVLCSSKICISVLCLVCITVCAWPSFHSCKWEHWYIYLYKAILGILNIYSCLFLIPRSCNLRSDRQLFMSMTCSFLKHKLLLEKVAFKYFHLILNVITCLAWLVLNIGLRTISGCMCSYWKMLVIIVLCCKLTFDLSCFMIGV